MQKTKTRILFTRNKQLISASDTEGDNSNVDSSPPYLTVLLVMDDFALTENDTNNKTNNKFLFCRRSATTCTDSARSEMERDLLAQYDILFEPLGIVGRTDGARIYLERGAKLINCHIDLSHGDLYIGENTVLDAFAHVQGPSIIGKRCHLRTGTRMRGWCILGNKVTFGGEIKGSILMNEASFPHQCYVGDSICGFRSHFGNGVTSANLGIFEGTKAESEFSPIVISVPDDVTSTSVDQKKKKPNVVRVDTGSPKLGIIMGDYCQVGCNSVSDPATFLAPWTIVYSLTAIRKGFYGPHEILKNKPFEAGVIQRAPLDKASL